MLKWQQTVKELYDAGLVDAVAMYEFDAQCLPRVKELAPQEIKKI